MHTCMGSLKGRRRMVSCFHYFMLFLVLLLLLVCDVKEGGGAVAANTIVCDNNALVRLRLDLKTLKYCHKNLPYNARAWDLVQRMTLDEKIAQLGDRAPGIPRLNLPPYNWRSEALHGVSDVGVGTHFDHDIPAATNFPAVILTAASFNEDLWKQIGVAVSDEARAMYNAGLSGLTFWSPNINVATDPRWGRLQETAGEDPFLVGRYAVNYVRGLQDVQGAQTNADPNSRPLKVAACCKYYTAYNQEGGSAKYHFTAKVPVKDLWETFNPPFEMCVKEGDVASVMCSYNKIGEVPVCADPKLLNGTIRGFWGLHGYIVGACDWVLARVTDQNNTAAEAIAEAYKAGVDLDCRGEYNPKYVNEAINQGKLTVGDIDKALVNLYTVLMRLGWFDGSPGDYSNLGKRDVCSAQNRELAVEAARQGIVLLENDQHVLPLQLNFTNKPTIAVIGPHAKATTAMLGNYALKTGKPCTYVSPLDALSWYANVKYAPGCPDVTCLDNAGKDEAVKVMDGTSATIVFVGLDQSIENEGSDVQDLYLPNSQTQLIKALLDAGGPSFVIVVIMSAGAIDISEWSYRASAVLWAGYPGAEGGRAIADVLFGKADPGGRLPITWYGRHYLDKVPKDSMQLRPKPDLGYPGRTYKFYKGNETVYPFGFGLSYTYFNYTRISLEPVSASVVRPVPQCRQLQYSTKGPAPPCPAYPVKDLKCNEMVKITVGVANVGKRRGTHVVLLYTVPPSNIVEVLPNKRLVGFQRVLILAGESVQVVFNLNICQSFSFFTEDAVEVLATGTHTIVVGNDLSALKGDNLLGEEESSLATAFPIQFRVEKLRRI